MLLCGSPVYEGISSPTKHSHSDRSLHVAIHFVVVILCIHTNGSTPMLILYFQSIVAFAFVIPIMHKWNFSFRVNDNVISKRAKICFSVEQEVDFLAPVSNGYLYQHRAGELGENAKR